MRVQNDHWSIILDCAEKNLQIITNKFVGSNERIENSALWDKLTILLNSIGMGQKTKDEWKKTLTDWRSKTKAKAGTLNTERMRTGGGPSTTINLSKYEETLLNIMAKSSYKGNPENIERGFRKRKVCDGKYYTSAFFANRSRLHNYRK
ncbi:hypothetical protein FQA39_LY17691 [Lamprigera yunnana]|nr:hypothetical protein FQA39_LY17691 [Lamprigera yunnana]